ncbi:MAG: hypothetical protein ACRCVU_13805 [Flavobacterium sp.]
MLKFERGDLVIVVADDARVKPEVKIGFIGTVICECKSNKYWVGVDFGDEFKGHNLRGKLDDNRGFFVPINILEYLEEENE